MRCNISQNIVLGSECLTDLRKLRVLIINMNWTSIEISRNLCLLNIGQLTLFDKALVTEYDLPLSFLFKSEDVGRFKAEIVKSWLAPMCITTSIEKNTNDLTETQGPIKDHDIVILSDAGSFAAVRKIEEHCIKLSKKFVYVSTNEFYAAAFFNFLFIESRVRFNHVQTLNIASLSYEKPGVIRLQEAHPFQRSDYISVEGLEDTRGFSNEEIRPVVRVVDDYAFEVEDTSRYMKLGVIEKGSATVTGVNYPSTHKARTVQQQMFSNEGDFDFSSPQLTADFKYIPAYLKYRDAIKSGVYATKEAAFESIWKDETVKGREESLRRGAEIHKEKILSRDVDKVRRLVPLENSLIAGLVSFEVLKINGLFLPQRAPIYLSALPLDFIFERRLTILGCGAKTHELLKILFVEAAIRQREYTVSIHDDNTITTDNSKNYFFASHTSIGMTKSSCLVKEVNARKSALKVREVDRGHLFKAVTNSDIIIITYGNYQTAYEMADMATCIKKPVFVLTEHLGEFCSLHLTDATLPRMEKYFVNKSDQWRLGSRTVDFPETTADVAEWTALLFESVFEHFYSEGELLKGTAKNTPFYALVVYLKSQFYEFLLTQTPNEANLIIEAILLFKLIFGWYPGRLSQAEDRGGRTADLKPIDFDFNNQLHQEFVISFIGMFKGVFLPTIPKGDDKQLLEHLIAMKDQKLPPLPDFSLRHIEESYKVNLRKIVKSEKYSHEYRIRHELIEFEKVKNFASCLYLLKLGLFDMKLKNKNEFDYYFFNEHVSLPTDGAILAGLLLNHMSKLGGEVPTVMTIDPSNCKWRVS